MASRVIDENTSLWYKKIVCLLLVYKSQRFQNCKNPSTCTCDAIDQTHKSLMLLLWETNTWKSYANVMKGLELS